MRHGKWLSVRLFFSSAFRLAPFSVSRSVSSSRFKRDRMSTTRTEIKRRGRTPRRKTGAHRLSIAGRRAAKVTIRMDGLYVDYYIEQKNSQGDGVRRQNFFALEPAIVFKMRQPKSEKK